MEFGSPTMELISEFLRKRLSEYKINKKEIEKLSSEAEGLSFADIEIACDDAVKIAILSNRKTIKLDEGRNTINENVSNLSKGIYIVRLTDSSNNEVMVKKLIKE